MRFEATRKAATITGVPEYRIRQMIREGTVPGFFAGKKYLINIDAFLKVLEQMCSVNATGNGDHSNE